MKPRNVLSTIAGLAASFIIIIVGEAVSHHLNPLPSNIDFHNAEALKKYITHAPASLHLIILANYALACLVGGFIAALIAVDKKIQKAMTIGGILMGLGIYNLVTISHPFWVIAASLFVFLPFAYFGGMIAMKITSKKSA